MNCHIVGVNECVSACNKLCVFICLFTFGEFINTLSLIFSDTKNYTNYQLQFIKSVSFDSLQIGVTFRVRGINPKYVKAK
jgi:hypothetical protein